MANPTTAVAFEASIPFLFLVASIILTYFWIFTNSKHKTSPSPPGPWGLPVLGYLPFLRADLHRQFAELAKQYGPIYQLKLGSKVCVVISSPQLIKQVVRDHDAIFANRDPPVSGLVLTGGGVDIVWSPNGPYWREMRKLFARDLLSSSNLQVSYQLRRKQVRNVVRDLAMQEGKTVRVGVLIFLTELNVVMNLIWGGTLKGDNLERLGGEFREKVVKIVELLGKPNVSDFFPVLAKFDIQRVARDMRETMEGVEAILDSCIQERMKMMAEAGNGEGRKDYLQIMLELKEQRSQENSSFGLAQIKALLMDVVVGGTDTTAAITEWVMAELLHRPEVIEKVQKELTDVVGMDAIVEESHIPRLLYLDAVVRETFRMHPPIPLLVPRSPSQSCDIGGYKIPKGSRVFLNAWLNHMDPDLWENPTEYRPERFMGDEGGKYDYMGNHFEYLPFGSGRRICPGVELAERMMMYLLATLIHSFDWRLEEGEKMGLSESFGIVMRKKTPLTAVPYRRWTDPNMYM